MDATTRFEIKVKGESTIALPAERAVLRVTVKSTGPKKKSVINDVLSSAQQLEPLLQQLSSPSHFVDANAAIDYWSRTSLRESVNTPYDSNERKYLPAEYTVRMEFEAHFRKFEAISDFITNITDTPYTEFNGVVWTALETSKESRRASLRSQAAKLAHGKALDFAAALGYSKVIPLTFTEGNTSDYATYRKGGPPPAETTTSSMKNLADAEAVPGDWNKVDRPAFRYQPEDIQMSLSVSATFYAVDGSL